jgi:hypothetical protein
MYSGSAGGSPVQTPLQLSDKTLLAWSNKNQLYNNNRASKIFAGY